MKIQSIIPPEPPSSRRIREGEVPRKSEYDNFNNDSKYTIVVGIIACAVTLFIGFLFGELIQTFIQ